MNPPSVRIQVHRAGKRQNPGRWEQSSQNQESTINLCGYNDRIQGGDKTETETGEDPVKAGSLMVSSKYLERGRREVRTASGDD